MRAWLGRRLRGHRRVKGLPPGLAHATLVDVCRAQIGEEPVRVAYDHLSGWKAAGAYRLHVRTRGGRRWSFVYKRAEYDPARTPALAGLPMRPGPAEEAVYGSDPGPLAAHLPNVYTCEVLEPSAVYDYCLEDLAAAGHRRLATDSDLVAAARALPDVHRAMAAWVAEHPTAALLDYDARFSAGLRDYAEQRLGPYVAACGDPRVRDAWAAWPQVAALHRDARPTAAATGWVHGDANPSNLHRRGGELRLVDWEWAGAGVPEQDLASLLKQASPEVEQACLTAAGADRAVYEWCQLERNLLDAAFIAAQLAGGTSAAKFDLDGFVVRSLQRMVQAAERLTR